MINEYYEGTPDVVYDTDTNATFRWSDDGTTCFGFFPVSLDNDYEFLMGHVMHRNLYEEAATKLMGKAIGVIEERHSDYIYWIEKQCYEKSYGLGRCWKNDYSSEYDYIISFWRLPNEEIIKEVIKHLGIDPKKCVLVEEDSQNMYEENVTVEDYILNGCSGYVEDGLEERNEPFKIDSRIEELIRSYNKPEETWQSMKEKEGWKTMAQRNSMIYQEGRINEYYTGNPDTVTELDDETYEVLRKWRYNDSSGISFGWFITSLDGGKEFVFGVDTSHYKLCKDIANKILGKAISSENITPLDIRDLTMAIYSLASFKGRTFEDAKVVTTWEKVSSPKLKEILDLIGGVEKYADYEYVFSGKKMGKLSVMDYINSNDTYLSQFEEEEISDETLYDSNWVSPSLLDMIREYNTPSSALAAKTSKLGNMTIAQYNSLIRQEGKKSKKTIKENNMKQNDEFSNYLDIMNEALKRNNFKAYEVARDMLDEAIGEMKHKEALLNEMKTNNFGILNHIFEQELPTLFKKNKKAVRNVIKTIKEDKNLLGEFNFYNVIKNQYNGDAALVAESNAVLDKLAEISVREIDLKTVIESNKKLKKVMFENGIVPSEFVDSESKALYESGHNILTKKKSASNMLQLIENYNVVCGYMDKHKGDKKNKNKNFDSLIEDFENKMKDTLNESEISFVQQITDFRTPIAEQRKEKLFNKFKNECINKINTMLNEDSDNLELKKLSEQINGMKFNNETIVKDIAKLLEIRDILMDD